MSGLSGPVRSGPETNACDPLGNREVRRAAGLPAVPTDPFSGTPLRMTGFGREPVIESVGSDGRYDKGLNHADLGRKLEGDLLFRLPS